MLECHPRSSDYTLSLTVLCLQDIIRQGEKVYLLDFLKIERNGRHLMQLIGSAYSLIICQGNGFYIIQEGKAKVLVKKGGKTEQVFRC